MNKYLQAKGRLRLGEMNKTETAYRDYLDQEKREGRVLEYWFESIKLKIANGSCWFTPDFMVLRPDGYVELHDVKGSPRIWSDDSKVKMKVCATAYPFGMYVVFPKGRKKENGWDIQEVAR